MCKASACNIFKLQYIYIKSSRNLLLLLLLFVEGKLLYVCDDELYFAKVKPYHSLFFLCLRLSTAANLSFAQTHTKRKTIFHILWQWIRPCIFQVLYSRISAYKSWSDSSHSAFLSSVSPIKCKHTHTERATGHFIFNEVKRTQYLATLNSI